MATPGGTKEALAPGLQQTYTSPVLDIHGKNGHNEVRNGRLPGALQSRLRNTALGTITNVRELGGLELPIPDLKKYGLIKDNLPPNTMRLNDYLEIEGREGIMARLGSNGGFINREGVAPELVISTIDATYRLSIPGTEDHCNGVFITRETREGLRNVYLREPLIREIKTEQGTAFEIIAQPQAHVLVTPEEAKDAKIVAEKEPFAFGTRIVRLGEGTLGIALTTIDMRDTSLIVDNTVRELTQILGVHRTVTENSWGIVDEELPPNTIRFGKFLEVTGGRDAVMDQFASFGGMLKTEGETSTPVLTFQEGGTTLKLRTYNGSVNGILVTREEGANIIESAFLRQPLIREVKGKRGKGFELVGQPFVHIPVDSDTNVNEDRGVPDNHPIAIDTTIVRLGGEIDGMSLKTIDLLHPIPEDRAIPDLPQMVAAQGMHRVGFNPLTPVIPGHEGIQYLVDEGFSNQQRNGKPVKEVNIDDGTTQPGEDTEDVRASQVIKLAEGESVSIFIQDGNVIVSFSRKGKVSEVLP